MKKITLLCMLLLTTMLSYGADRYVSANGNDSTGDGTIGNPFLTLEFVHDQSAGSGDTIIIDGSGGVISRVARFVFKKNITLLGINNAIIDGASFITTVAGEQSLFVAFNGKIVVVKDLTLQNFNSTERGSILNSTGNTVDFTFDNCTIDNNSSTSFGGAIYAIAGTLRLKDCNFTNNTSTTHGGAIYLGGATTIENCKFTGNEGSRASAFYFSSDEPLNISRCTFDSNIGTDHGGAGFISGNGTVSIDKSLFLNNQAGAASSGGALFLYPKDNQDITIVNSTFFQNTAQTGGAINLIGEPNNTSVNNSATFTNLTVVQNTSTLGSSGAIRTTGNLATSQNVATTINNCIVTGNIESAGVPSNDIIRTVDVVVELNHSVVGAINGGFTVVNSSVSQTVTFNNEAAVIAGTDKVLKYSNTEHPVLFGEASYLTVFEDQLGLSRASSSAVDAGAWESNLTPPVASVKSELLEKGFTIYTNLSDSSVRISAPEVVNGVVSIYSLLGQKIVDVEIRNGQAAFSSANIDSGVYVARISASAINIAKKFIIR